MNITKETIEAVEELFSYNFYDNNLNIVPYNKAEFLHIGFTKGDFQYISKDIKSTKKEITLEYILNKINNDKTFKNFSNTFSKLIEIPGTSIYPTSYGIGVFVAFGFRDKINNIKKSIESKLDLLKLNYTTEYSEGGWVFRYKISKSQKNITIINNL